MFTGDVYFDVIACGDGTSRMRVNTVRFSPCARCQVRVRVVSSRTNEVCLVVPSVPVKVMVMVCPA
jgi:hypothetical protein